MIIVNERLYFNNSIGDISAVDINDGLLLWQLPTQSSLIYEAAFSLELQILFLMKHYFFQITKISFLLSILVQGVLTGKIKLILILDLV